MKVRANRPSLQALAPALEARDPYTRGHSECVTSYAAIIGEELSLPHCEKEDLRLRGFLHDIGKLGASGTRFSRASTAST